MLDIEVEVLRKNGALYKGYLVDVLVDDVCVTFEGDWMSDTKFPLSQVHLPPETPAIKPEYTEGQEVQLYSRATDQEPFGDTKINLKMDTDETTSVSPGAKYKRRISYEPSADEVHWIRNSMAQWYQICTDFSSADPDKQQAAYKDLLHLNIMYTKDTPSGMKCTLNFLKVRVQDKMFTAQIIENQLDDDMEVLRGMYISAIQEFMDILDKTNHLTSGISKFELPDFLLDISNEICHSEKPTIEKLRAAAHQCIDWLQDKYWINQSKMASRWMEMEVKVKDDLREMMTALDKYLGHYFKGNTLIRSIPDENFHRHVKERFKKFKFPERNNMRQKLINKKLLAEKDISVPLIVLVKDITEYLKQNRGILTVEKLAEMLLERNYFLPSQHLRCSLDPERCGIDDALPNKFLKIWNGIFEFLPQKQFIPALFSKLIELTINGKESEERQAAAAIWIKTLANSVMPVRDTLQLMKPELASGKQGKRKISFERKLMQKVTDGGNMIRLRLQLPTQQLQQSINFKRVVYPIPNNWTTIYLQSLMFLQEPRLSEREEKLLIELVHIYTGDNCNKDSIKEFSYDETTIHTVEELEAIEMQLSKHGGKDNGDNNHHRIPWVHNVEEWGSNSRHYQLKILTDDLPRASLWQSELQE